VIYVTKSLPGFSLEKAVSAWEVAGHHSASCWQPVVLVSGRTEVWVGCSEVRWGFRKPHRMEGPDPEGYGGCHSDSSMSLSGWLIRLQDARGQPLFLAVEPELQPPPLSAGRRDFQIQSARVEKLHGLVAGFDATDLAVGQGHKSGGNSFSRSAVAPRCQEIALDAIGRLFSTTSSF